MKSSCLQKGSRIGDSISNSKNIQSGYWNVIWGRKIYHSHNEFEFEKQRKE